MKPIVLTGHAREQISERGTTEDEVVYTVRNVPWNPARLGRLQCTLDFVYRADWKGHYYSTKQVNPIFVEEETRIVIVTVYVYYF